jgi:hypothetical protein
MHKLSLEEKIRYILHDKKHGRKKNHPQTRQSYSDKLRGKNQYMEDE